MHSEKAENIRNLVNENVEEMAEMLKAAAQAVRDNPSLKGDLKFLVGQYGDLLCHVAGEMHEEIIGARATMFRRLCAQGFSADQAMKLVLGR